MTLDKIKLKLKSKCSNGVNYFESFTNQQVFICKSVIWKIQSDLKKLNIIYFWLRFGLANAINNY